MNKGIYIHIPFCKKKCHYCNFYSTTNINLKRDFVNAIKKEIKIKQSRFPNFFSKDSTFSLYIGGGNPSTFDIEELTHLFSAIKTMNLKFDEITVELNPDGVTEEKLILLKNFGVNRISLGIQSFLDNILTFLGRPHNAKEALKSIEAVSKYFTNFSIDIIGGIPVVERDWKIDYGFIKALLPPHISFYLLSIEEGTEFFNKVYIDEEQQASEYTNFCEFCKSLGYRHYEISNFCSKNNFSRHNLVYWKRCEYMGFGPSAASFIKHCDTEIRIINNKKIEAYLETPGAVEIEYLGEKEKLFEELFLPLRTDFGLKLTELTRKFPALETKLTTNIEKLIELKLLEKKGENIIIPEKHFLITNEIILKIIPI